TKRLQNMHACAACVDLLWFAHVRPPAPPYRTSASDPGWRAARVRSVGPAIELHACRGRTEPDPVFDQPPGGRARAAGLQETVRAQDAGTGIDRRRRPIVAGGAPVACRH